MDELLHDPHACRWYRDLCLLDVDLRLLIRGDRADAAHESVRRKAEGHPPFIGGNLDVTLIDKNDAFVLGYSKLDLMFGHTTLDAVRLPYRNFVKPGVNFRQETITAIDPNARRVTTNVQTYEADFLVIALGADYDMDATPGLAECGSEFYSVAGAARLRDLLHILKGPRDHWRLRGSIQVPAGAQRMRPDAARLPSQRGRPRGLRNQLRAAVAESGAALARNLASAGGGLHRAQHQIYSRSPCGLCRRRPQGRNSR